MKCPYCGELDTKVLDSRAIQDATTIRRRRQCAGCANRFSTKEKIEEEPIVVIKRDGRRELFDAGKILRGLILAGQKRDIPRSTWEEMVESLEQDLRSSYTREVTTDKIGDILLGRLRIIDEVAYVRFASVFRQFQDVETFKVELEEMLSQKMK
ncbi:MAG TPA: transcriptional regulator NrdR [Candidatus Limnocylindrales bacterium]|nr:transcriptional regulator NrdR [Candidatus Limnocylindrales bacterium]